MRLLEVTQTDPAALRVDRAARVLRGVRVLGATSINNRQYTKAAVDAAAPMYNNQSVFYDHPTEANQVRSVADKAGWLEDVHPDQHGGLTGNFHYLQNDTRIGKIIEAAERSPEQFGLSHNVEADCRREGDRVVVEAITAVRSVDIVTNPASTKSLFEHQEQIQMQEQLLTPPSADALQAEPIAAEVVPETSPEEAAVDTVAAAFKKAIIAVLDNADLDLAAQKKQIAGLLDQKEKAVDAVAGEIGAEATEAPAAEPAAEGVVTKGLIAGTRALREEVAELRSRNEARDLLDANPHIIPTPARVAALSRTPTAERAALLESWADSTASRPRSGMPIREGKESGFPETTKDFADRITT